MTETTTEEPKSLEDQILDSAYLGIISYSCLILTTIIASGFFGIPRFLVTDSETFVDHNVATRIIFKLPLFFLSSLFAFVGYFFVSAYQMVLKIKDGNITPAGFDEIYEKNKWFHTNTINFISMVILTGWALLLYKNIKQSRIVKQIITEEDATK